MQLEWALILDQADGKSIGGPTGLAYLLVRLWYREFMAVINGGGGPDYCRRH
jgi:hypothetical protein